MQDKALESLAVITANYYELKIQGLLRKIDFDYTGKKQIYKMDDNIYNIRKETVLFMLNEQKE